MIRIILYDGKLESATLLPDNSGLANSRICTLAENEKKHIIKALKSTNWQIGGDFAAANLLGMKRTPLHPRMNKLGITKPK